MITTLQQCLERESEVVEAFINALADETTALMDRKAHAALALASQAKEDLAEELVVLSNQRDELLAQMGLPGGHAGTQEAVEQSPEMAPIWTKLLQQANLARDGNERNAAIIHASLRYTEQSLDALHKIAQQASSGQTYTAQGRGGRPGYGLRNIVAR